MRALLVCAGLTLAAGQAHAQFADFRVRPYLQWPTTEAITIMWFTAVNQPGTLTITGPGLSAPLTLSSTPELLAEIDYSASEKAISPRPADMEWPDNSNYRHQLRVSGLLPDSVYTYTVAQGANTFTATFRTAPTADSQRPLRFHLLSDSETLIIGRTTNREWSTGAQDPNSTGRPAGSGRGRTTYFLTETVGYQQNIIAMRSRNPDMIVMPGDLIQGSGNEPQRRWDEFWRHNAGVYDTILSSIPLTAAIGNNCIFYNSWSNNTTIQTARRQWSAYWDFAPNGNPAFQDLYHRQDYGPVTILTLCSVKGISPDNHLVAPPLGQPTTNPSDNRDTNRVWNNLYTFGDVPDLNQYLDAARTVESEQFRWLRENLQQARAAGQVIFVQWHHIPYSRGIHGSSITSTQSGEAMRQWTPLLEEFRVAGVFCGHSEVAERSFVDADGDGYGINYWDVGAAGDGLRGVETAFSNPFSQWTADQSERELWSGNQLVRGGKHYGFQELNVSRLPGGRFRVSFTPYHIFPVNAGDPNFTVTGVQLRRYNDLVTLEGPADNLRPVPLCTADTNNDGVVDFNDLLEYLNLYNVTDPGADLNADGVVDFNDLLAYLNAYNAGC
jgi:hypothetical protein